MASFVGTKEEFKRYVGPMLRNLVQQLTRKHRKKVGRCEHCGTTEMLEAAHVHGKERGTIIDNILDNYTNNSVITIDLANFEQHFRNEHKVVDETILILCKACHVIYDSPPIIEGPKTPPKGISPIPEPDPNPPRLFSNKEIQFKISEVAQNLPAYDLDNLCDPLFSKEVFRMNFPIFKKVPKDATSEFKSSIIKDEKGRSRWTWKYEFEKDGYIYAITTQWYPKNDPFVKNWLDKHK